MWKTLIGLFVIACVLLGVVFFTVQGSQTQFDLEIFKSLLQLVVVIIIGGTIAYLFKEAEQRREWFLREAEERQEQSRVRAAVRVDYLNRLGIAYRGVKAARR